MKAAIGIAIVVAHAVGFAALAQRSRGQPFAVDLERNTATTSRAEMHDDGDRPGLRRRWWTARYRGGFVRQIGASRLAGPFQDPAALACSGRVVVGQRMLDAIAPAVGSRLDDELRGESIFGAGDYRRIDHFSLRWAELAAHPGDAAFVGDAPHGYARATAEIVFDRIAVPITVAFVPEHAGQFRIATHAELALGNSALQWLSDKLGGNRLATRLARRQIDKVLATALAPPPPFELPGGQQLQFVYCADPVEIADGAFGALPFAISIGTRDGLAPPHIARTAARPLPASDTQIAIDLDVDALNAMLFELWRTGWLDRQLAQIGLDRWFNADADVARYLSIRLSPISLALPPVVEPDGDHLRLAADARVTIHDGDAVTIGRVFGALAFHFDRGARLPIAVDVGAVELSCQRDPTTRVACYDDLVGALRDRGGQFQGALTAAFARLVTDVFVDREVAGLPIKIVISDAAPSVAGQTLHLELAARLR